MRLKISHRTSYHYDVPVHYALQRLRLTPRTLGPQTVESWTVVAEGASIDCDYVDGYGNRVHLARATGQAVSDIVLTASGVVHTRDTVGVLGEVYGAAPLWLFTRETPMTEADEAIAALGHEHLSGQDRLAGLHALSAALRDVMDYEPGRTDVTTSAVEAFALGKGVCQDHAHVFVAACRAAAVPSRYVSGYLLVEDGSGHVASHAWAEAHVDGLGWVGFDVANRWCPDARYVRVASGLDYRDAAPVSGLRQGLGEERLEVQVVVDQ